ncbi:cellulase family glycosylhydrolase [Rubripirellula reticaptiva]|nr:cellulase family glycosylhydrolase [Rubripirellula reticaptiva]
MLLLSRSIGLLVLIAVGICFSLARPCVYAQEQTTPKRPGVFRQNDLVTVRGGDGEMLRGVAVFVFKYRRSDVQQSGVALLDDIDSDTYWDELVDRGINAVRVVYFDPWQRSHGDAGASDPYPFADLDNADDVAATLRDIDKAVEQADRRGMSVMINYHDTGGYRDPLHTVAADDRHFSYGESMQYCQRFWKLVASRYRNQAHVFYELTNEPVRWHPNDYTATDLENFASLYGQVRSDAPETHVVLVSAATTASWDRRRNLLFLARELEKRGVDFSNASIGFHPYSLADIDADGQACSPQVADLDLIKPVTELMRAGYAALNTEQNFPTGTIESEDPDSPPLLKGDSTGIQSMQRLGISWFLWNTSGPKEMRNLDWLITDAAKHGYAW